jgi:hypothetical protein
MIIVAMATVPKSEGDNNRDRMAVIIREIKIPIYFDIPVYRMPDINIFFIAIIESPFSKRI